MRYFTLLICVCLAGCGSEPEEILSITTEPVVDTKLTNDDVKTDVVNVEETPEVPEVPEVELGPFGGDRPADVVLPRDWSADGSYPVVVLLHGFGASARIQNVYLRTSALVDDFQFVLVLPDGKKTRGGQGFWNSTDICCDIDRTGVDDSTYLSDLGQEAIARYAGNPDQLYFMGHSNGGYMSYRLACDHSDQIAGIASLAGSSWIDAADCGSPEPVAVLQIHGTADPTVAYAGQPGQPGAQEVVDRWRDRNGCTSGPEFIGSADFDTAVQGPETRKDAFGGCDAGTSVELWSMNGSGHIPNTGEELTRDILAFLLSHEKQ